jgi:pimeloyl-ACP methyl ester carboxylesterase
MTENSTGSPTENASGNAAGSLPEGVYLPGHTHPSDHPPSHPQALPRDLPRITFEHQRVRTDDGVELSVQVTGDGPPVLLANGIGVVRPGLDFLAAHLAPRHRVICWDYRGAGASRLEEPRSVASAGEAFGMQRQARDALCILDHLDVSRAAVLGWSMGVPVGLELYRLAPDRVGGLGALFGAAGRPFLQAFGAPISGAVERFVGLLFRVPGPAQLLMDAAVALPPVAWAVLTTARFVGPGAHRKNFAANVHAVANAHRRIYFGTLRELARHDAHDLLPEVRCPTLVVAGGKDLLTPPAAARRMAEVLPDAELVIIPDASHFGVIEHGPALWDPVDRLLQRTFAP